MPDNGLPRLVEKALSVGGLVASAPVLAIAGAAIVMSSRGPILFRQRRVGLGGKPFTLFKLRTMRTGPGGPAVTAGGDSRVTRVGRLLRRSKLDELPELWNVVRGDLSLVGPRPEVPDFVDLNDARWRRVLEARPGLTHPVTLRLRNEEQLLAGVNGDRTSYYANTLLPYKLDGYIRYMDRRSWQTDLRVIFETALAIVMPERTPPPSAEEVAAVVSEPEEGAE